VIGEGTSSNCQSLIGDDQFPTHYNHSPSGSVSVGFGNNDPADPISVVVTLTPFFQGVANRDGGKSITIQVNLFKQLPQGVPGPASQKPD